MVGTVSEESVPAGAAATVGPRDEVTELSGRARDYLLRRLAFEHGNHGFLCEMKVKDRVRSRKLRGSWNRSSMDRIVRDSCTISRF